MNIDEKLDALKKISRVEAPPFMLTRIMESVQSPGLAPAPSTWRVAFFGIAIIMLSLNLSLFFGGSTTDSNAGVSEVISSLQLSTTNELYHD